MTSMTTTNTAKRTITLGPAEKFRIWGRLVTRLIAEDRDTPVTDETWFAMYDHRGYVGAIRLRDSAEVANIVERRKSYLR